METATAKSCFNSCPKIKQKENTKRTSRQPHRISQTGADCVNDCVLLSTEVAVT